jgi:hypothetical protein
MGFAAPANVAPARRLAAAFAAAAIFCAVTDAGGTAGGAAPVVTDDAGADDLAAVGVFPLAAAVVEPRSAPALVRDALERAASNVPIPLVPSVRAGPPSSEAPSSTSGSSSSPDGELEEDSVGMSAVSGRASGAGAATKAEADDRSSKSPCESKSSPDSCEGLFAVPDDGTATMGSSTGRSARGSSLGREAASILNVSCNAIAEVPRRWLTDRKRPSPQCDAHHTLLPVPVQLTRQKP